MNNDNPKQPQGDKAADTQPAAKPDSAAPPKPDESDRDQRKPEDLTAEELRLMADTMPGDGPGDD